MTLAYHINSPLLSPILKWWQGVNVKAEMREKDCCMQQLSMGYPGIHINSVLKSQAVALELLLYVRQPILTIIFEL